MHQVKVYKPYQDVIYLMTGYLVSDVYEPRYPQFDIYLNESILFHTLEETERKIAELIKNEQLQNERACFFVYEIPIGINCYPEQGQKVRSYTANGELNSESMVSGLEDCNGHMAVFPGRDENDCKFAIGDRVAVFNGDHFSLETVYALPVNSTFVDEHLHDTSVCALPDYTDDCYITIPDGGDYYEHHNHPPVWNCFPL